MASRQSVNILTNKPIWQSARANVSVTPARLHMNRPFPRHYTLYSTAKRAGRRGGGEGGKGYSASSWTPYLGAASAAALAVGALAYTTLYTPTPTKLDSLPLVQLDQATKQAGPITDSSPMRLRMEKMIKEKQKEIVAELGRLDGKQFLVDEWTRDDGTGGGISCVLQDGQVFEKAGCNVSVVYGKLSRPAIEKMRADHKSLLDATPTDSEGELNFFAAGLSMVIHPHNPMAPTTHLNYRYFETSDPRDPINGKTRWWFGGGADLTPTYIFEDDCKHFHNTLKDVCDKHDPVYYPRFKKWCDDYFWLPHRKEGRGVGGIFFDDLDEGFLKSIGASTTDARDKLFSFATDCLAAFLPSYVPIIEKRKNMPFTPNQKEWQQIRRGRYVEFNLIYDRGTQFGLRAPNARTESILMSLPRIAMWRYMDPVSGTRTEQQKLQEKKEQEKEKRGGGKCEGEEECCCREDKNMTEEEKLMDILRRPREWA